MSHDQIRTPIAIKPLNLLDLAAINDVVAAPSPATKAYVRRRGALSAPVSDSIVKQRKTQLRDLAAHCARALPLNSRPLQNEGAGNAGRPMRPRSRVQ